MTIDDKFRDGKLRYDIKREESKILALSSGKIGKYEFLIGQKIFLSNQRLITEQAQFPYSPLGKAFEKQRLKQIGAIKSLKMSNKKDKYKQIEGIFSKNLMNYLIRDKLKEIVKTDNLRYKSKIRKVYNFSENYLPILFIYNYLYT